MLHKILEKYAHRWIFSKAHAPNGLNPFWELQRHFGRSPQIRVILDVGANIGQSALFFAEQLPLAEIHSFEPVLATFAQLQENCQAFPRIRCHNLGMAAEPGQTIIKLAEDSLVNSLRNQTATETGTSTETLQITTLDHFLQEHDLQQVDYLKIDTEGFEKAVLEGAKKSLANKTIRAIQLEATFDPENQNQSSMMELHPYLEGQGYQLFGIYDQTRHPWDKRLRFANLLYIEPESF